MGKATLVIMAAGIGSRFGGGIKQLEPVGPNGEIIMDYSVYDALEAGFDKVVFVIRKDLEKDFKEIIGSRIERIAAVEYVFQEVGDIPAEYENKFSERTKPWGTGQAILCCRKAVAEPFLVINADDYYGKRAYVEAFRYLTGHAGENVDGKLSLCMVGFVLKNTLSDNGGVTRGICHVDADRMLADITETKNIVKSRDGACVVTSDGEKEIDVNCEVSMNMWGLSPEIFEVLETGFEEFLRSIPAGDQKAEYLLPTIIGGLLERGLAKVKVLSSSDQWFGVTYKEDKEGVVQAVRRLIAEGVYKEKLF